MAKAIMFGGATGVYGAPADWDETKHGPCVGLPVLVDAPYIYSYWKLSWKERIRALWGHPIRLCVVGAQPAVAIEVTRVGR